MTVSRDRTAIWDMTLGNVQFRAWVQATHDRFLAVGLTQTADTGQIDPATVTFPVAEGSAGFEIWRFNDAEQAGNPIYFKITYERGDTAQEVRYSFQVGRGSNGSGTLTSPGTLMSSTTAGGLDSALFRLIHASLIDGELVFYASPNTTSGDGFMLVISRLKTRAGAFNGDVGVLAALSTASVIQAWSGGAWNTITVALAAPPFESADGALPAAPIYFRGYPRPIRGIAFILGTAVAEADSGALTLEGDSRQFIVLGQATGGVFSTTTPLSPTGGANTAPLMCVRNE